MTAPVVAPRLAASYFDGASGRAHPVVAWVEAGRLNWAAEGSPARAVATNTAVWPERQRHGQRHVQLPDGGVLVFADAHAFDVWATAAGRGPRGVVRWQLSWRLTSLAALLLVATLLVMWRWAIPAVARAAAAWLPEAVQVEIGQRTLTYIDDAWLKPSQLDAQAQANVVQRFEKAAQAAQRVTGPLPPYRILFRSSGKLGPNAFALPGGDIVVTDALVEVLLDKPEAVTGVLAHELGHVVHRHGLRQAAQTAAVGLIAGLIVGDFSALLAGAPALMAQMDYSRDFERQADLYARDLLRGAGIDPRVMVVSFERAEKAAQDRNKPTLPIAFSSHPATQERTAFFSEP